MNAVRLPPPDDNGNGGVSTFRALLLQILSEQSLTQTALGDLQAKSTILISNDQQARDSRTELHRKLELSNTQIAATSTEVALLRHEVSRIAPLVDRHEEDRNRTAGERVGTTRVSKLALTIGAAIVTAVASVVAFLIDLAVRLLTTVGGRH